MYVSRSGRKQHQQQQSKASRHKPPWSLFCNMTTFFDDWFVLEWHVVYTLFGSMRYCLGDWQQAIKGVSQRGLCVYMLVVHLLNCKLSFTLHYHQLLSMSLSFPYPLYPPYFYFFPLSSDMCLIYTFLFISFPLFLLSGWHIVVTYLDSSTNNNTESRAASWAKYCSLVSAMISLTRYWINTDSLSQILTRSWNYWMMHLYKPMLIMDTRIWQRMMHHQWSHMFMSLLHDCIILCEDEKNMLVWFSGMRCSSLSWLWYSCPLLQRRFRIRQINHTSAFVKWTPPPVGSDQTWRQNP